LNTQNLIQGDDFCGFVTEMDFKETKAVTNDQWKSNVGGIPRGTFLLATEQSPGPLTSRAYLLRVISTGRPPNAETLQQLRFDTLSRLQNPFADVRLDPITEAQLQTGVLACRVLGTFFPVTGGNISFSADVENVRSGGSLRVFKPSGLALEAVVNCVPPNLVRNRTIISGMTRTGKTTFWGPPYLAIGP